MENEMTVLEKAVNYWNEINPMERAEIISKVGVNKSVTITYRLCIKYIAANKLYE